MREGKLLRGLGELRFGWDANRGIQVPNAGAYFLQNLLTVR